jgi:hypothetical protein
LSFTLSRRNRTILGNGDNLFGSRPLTFGAQLSAEIASTGLRSTVPFPFHRKKRNNDTEVGNFWTGRHPLTAALPKILAVVSKINSSPTPQALALNYLRFRNRAKKSVFSNCFVNCGGICTQSMVLVEETKSAI